MNQNWTSAIAFVLQWEGGYVNNPADPGGETRFGIAKRSHPNVDIANLTPAQAIEIYRAEYWTPIVGDSLPAGVDLFALDTAVNCGVKRCLDWLALAQKPSSLSTLRELAARRIYHYELLDKIDDIFGLGWARRTLAAYDGAHALMAV